MDIIPPISTLGDVDLDFEGVRSRGFGVDDGDFLCECEWLCFDDGDGDFGDFGDLGDGEVGGDTAMPYL